MTGRFDTSRFIRYELKQWNCTKSLTILGIVCAWTFGVTWNYLHLNWINFYWKLPVTHSQIPSIKTMRGHQKVSGWRSFVPQGQSKLSVIMRWPYWRVSVSRGLTVYFINISNVLFMLVSCVIKPVLCARVLTRQICNTNEYYTSVKICPLPMWTLWISPFRWI